MHSSIYIVLLVVCVLLTCSFCSKSHLCIALFTATFVPTVIQRCTSSFCLCIALHPIHTAHPIYPFSYLSLWFLSTMTISPWIFGQISWRIQRVVELLSCISIYSFLLGSAWLLFKAMALIVFTSSRWAGELPFLPLLTSTSLEIISLYSFSTFKKLFALYSLISFARVLSMWNPFKEPVFDFVFQLKYFLFVFCSLDWFLNLFSYERFMVWLTLWHWFPELK